MKKMLTMQMSDTTPHGHCLKTIVLDSLLVTKNRPLIILQLNGTNLHGFLGKSTGTDADFRFHSHSVLYTFLGNVFLKGNL